MSILNVVNTNLGTNYGFSYDGRLTLHLNPMFVNELKKFLYAASPCLTKMSKFKSDCKKDFFTLTKAKEIIKALL